MTSSVTYDSTIEKRFRHTQFLTSAAHLEQCPPAASMEIAFVGRSNVGKSSVINTLCHQKALAKTSKTPGRTQLINFFQVDNNLQLVDLPGYGYAKVSRSQQQLWAKEITRFLSQRHSLHALVLIADIRHGLKASDETLLQLASNITLPVHILLNKADKLSRSQAQHALFTLRKQRGAKPGLTCQTFSAANRHGADDFYAHVEHLLNALPPSDDHTPYPPPTASSTTPPETCTAEPPSLPD